MRPDEDPRLKSMGIGNATCDKCFMEFYSNAEDSICDDCQLNPLTKGDKEKNSFIKDAIEQESTFTAEELLEQNKKMNN